MMKIVLVRPPFYSLFGVTTPKLKTYPLNLLYLATYVRERGGHEVAVFDGENVSVPGLASSDGPAEAPEIIMNRGIPRMVSILQDPGHAVWQEIERRIIAHHPDIVGITCNSGNMDTVHVLVTRLKAHGIPVILGGSHPTVLPAQSIRYTGADMVAVGEGEVTLLNVLNALEGNGALAETPGLAWQRGGAIEVNPRGSLIENIDDLPLPDRSLIDRSDYFGEVLMTGRGCPFNCAYCASRTIWGRKVRLRSVSSLVEELTRLKQQAETSPPRPGQWVIKVVDDTFTVSKRRTLELLDEIISRGLNCFEFTGGVRADTLDEALVDRMRRANFLRVTLGVESGSPRILEMIRKGETNADVKRAVKLLRDAGIRSHAFFMIGFPGETEEDIELSRRLILEAEPDHVEINMVTPYPGTDIFEKLIADDPETIDRWYRWFHQGMSTHSDALGYDLDRAHQELLAFAQEYHQRRAEHEPDRF